MDTNTSGKASKSDCWEASYADGTVLRYKYEEKWVDDLINPELVGLKIPEGVVKIEYLRLGICHKLESIHFPASLLEIGRIMIANENCLQSITVDEDNPKYSARKDILYTKDKSKLIRFHNKSDISHFSILPEVHEIGQRAFENCQYLQTLEIPCSVTSIGEGAFLNCQNLEELILPNSIESFSLKTISSCHRLKRIYLLTNIKELTDLDIKGCEALNRFYVDATNPNFSSADDVIFNKDKTTLVRYPPNKAGDSYTIPESVLIIGDYAFGNCENLTKIKLPRGLKYISEGAFEGCRKLESINIPDKVEVIRYHVFSGCYNLREITIPRSVKRIESFVFDSCRSLTSINVDEYNLHYKSADGVIYSKNNETLVRYPPGKTGATFDIPAGVTTINESAFKNCMNLTRITIPNSVKTIQSLAFSYCNNLQEINIPASTTSIYPYAFDYSPLLKNLKGDGENGKSREIDE